MRRYPSAQAMPWPGAGNQPAGEMPWRWASGVVHVSARVHVVGPRTRSRRSPLGRSVPEVVHEAIWGPAATPQPALPAPDACRQWIRGHLVRRRLRSSRYDSITGPPLTTPAPAPAHQAGWAVQPTRRDDRDQASACLRAPRESRVTVRAPSRWVALWLGTARRSMWDLNSPRASWRSGALWKPWRDAQLGPPPAPQGPQVDLYHVPSGHQPVDFFKSWHDLPVRMSRR